MAGKSQLAQRAVASVPNNRATSLPDPSRYPAKAKAALLQYTAYGLLRYGLERRRLKTHLI